MKIWVIAALALVLLVSVAASGVPRLVLIEQFTNVG